jgi:hypothetical protein
MSAGERGDPGDGRERAAGRLDGDDTRRGAESPSQAERGGVEGAIGEGQPAGSLDHAGGVWLGQCPRAQAIKEGQVEAVSLRG